MTFTMSFTPFPPSSLTGSPFSSSWVRVSHTSRSASRGMSRKCSPLKREGFTNKGLNW